MEAAMTLQIGSKLWVETVLNQTSLFGVLSRELGQTKLVQSSGGVKTSRPLVIQTLKTGFFVILCW
jgi:hypothetical protein